MHLLRTSSIPSKVLSIYIEHLEKDNQDSKGKTFLKRPSSSLFTRNDENFNLFSNELKREKSSKSFLSKSDKQRLLTYEANSKEVEKRKFEKKSQLLGMLGKGTEEHNLPFRSPRNETYTEPDNDYLKRMSNTRLSSKIKSIV